MTEREIQGLVCPGCGDELHGSYAEANYGRVVLVDQCPSCGGVWFDRWELYFLKPGSLKELAGVDEKKFLAINPLLKGTGECPKCAEDLEPFNDPSLPADATIERCPSCSGLWLNRGGLERYADHRASMTGIADGEGRSPGPGASPPEAREARLDTLKKLQKELDTRNIAEPARALDSVNEQLDGREFAKDAAFLILQTLLKLIFKF